MATLTALVFIAMMLAIAFAAVCWGRFALAETRRLKREEACFGAPPRLDQGSGGNIISLPWRWHRRGWTDDGDAA